MAIIPQIHGLSVTVKVAGETTTEYAPHEDEGGPTTGLPTTRCYIESTSGVTFSIQAKIGREFDLTAPANLIVLEVYIDEKKVESLVIKFTDLGRQWPYVKEIRNSWTEAATPGCAVEQFFKFALISPVEDAVKARVALDTKRAKSLGIIRVRVVRGHGRKPSSRDRPCRYDTLPGKGFRIAEKSMKGRELSHATTFSADALRRHKQTLIRITREHSVGEFFFEYRSRSALQKEMILPASPAPSPSPTADRVNKMTVQELRRFARDMLRCKQISCCYVLLAKCAVACGLTRMVADSKWQENSPPGCAATIKQDYDE